MGLRVAGVKQTNPGRFEGERWDDLRAILPRSVGALTIRRFPSLRKRLAGRFVCICDLSRNAGRGGEVGLMRLRCVLA